MPPDTVAAVIVAAGSGRRLGSTVPKQFLPLAGRPMLFHSLAAFLAVPEIQQLVVVLPAGAEVDLPPRVERVAGGDTRQESVRHGLDAVAEAGWVLVHDAARPLVSPDLIRRTLAEARRSGAAVPVLPVADTLKRVQGQALVGTVDRSALVSVQTPQAFRADLLRQAHQAAVRQGTHGTDDAQLVEHLGATVTWVPGSPRNLKITTEEDLGMAAALVAAP